MALGDGSLQHRVSGCARTGRS